MNLKISLDDLLAHIAKKKAELGKKLPKSERRDASKLKDILV